MSDVHEIYAIKYAHHDRNASENFIGGDVHDKPMPLDYYIWAIRGGGKLRILDTGFDAQMARRRRRDFVADPGERLRAIGIDAAKVDDVIISHMHYDHCGNYDLFPNARFHLQERELAYATGRYMRYPRLSHSFEVEDICGIVRLNYARRVLFYHGDAQIAPGLSVHAAGGHSAGLQFVRVRTRRGFEPSFRARSKNRN